MLAFYSTKVIRSNLATSTGFITFRCDRSTTPQMPRRPKNAKTSKHITPMEMDIKIAYSTKKDCNNIEPLTKDQIRKLKVINRDCIVRDQDGKIAARLYTQQLISRDLNTCLRAAKHLMDNIEAEEVNRPHIGEWRHYRSFIEESQDYRNAEAFYNTHGQTPFWRNKSVQNIVKKIDFLFGCLDRKLFQQYKAVKAPLRLFGKAFLMAVINKGGTTPHYDSMDEMEGLCCVIPMGNFTGGELVFREHNLRFQVKPGDIIFFRSRDILHENLAFEGDRYSIVFTTHHDDFTEYGQVVQRQYRHRVQKPVKSAVNYAKQGLTPAQARAQKAVKRKVTQKFTRESRRTKKII